MVTWLVGDSISVLTAVIKRRVSGRVSFSQCCPVSHGATPKCRMCVSPPHPSNNSPARACFPVSSRGRLEPTWNRSTFRVATSPKQQHRLPRQPFGRGPPLARCCLLGLAVRLRHSAREASVRSRDLLLSLFILVAELLRSSSSATLLWLVIAALGVVWSRQNGSVSGRTSGSRGLEIGAAKRLLGGGKRPQGGLGLLDRHRQNRPPLDLSSGALGHHLVVFRRAAGRTAATEGKLCDWGSQSHPRRGAVDRTPWKSARTTHG